MTADTHTAVTVLAEALDQLGARIYRDINPDSSYENITDPHLLKLLNEFSGFADECLTALDHPAVREALDAVRKDQP
jgi:hypothetical protein